MSEPPNAIEIAGRLETNWLALRPIANRDVEMPGVAVEDPREGLIFDIPAIVRQALVDAASADGPPLKVLKLAEIVNGALVRLVDDGTPLPGPDVVHLVVNVVTIHGDSAASSTYEVVARPADGRESASTVPVPASDQDPECGPSDGARPA